ncbi:MAG: response regulator [bacterium]|nr:response regulator [bacterium]
MEEFVLVVDDESPVRELLKSQLSFLGFSVRDTGDASEALTIAASPVPPALVLLDIEMPEASGFDLLRQIKKIDEDIQVVMVSGLHDLGTVRRCVHAGAYDYLAKPFELDDLHSTVDRAYERRGLIRENRKYQDHLKAMVEARTQEARGARDIALLTLAKLAESRDTDTGMHLARMSEYSQILAENLAYSPYADRIDEEFVESVYRSSPLHDIGKVAIPDSILCKPGALTDEEFAIMRTHTTVGGDTLRSVLEKHRGQTSLAMAMEIAYSHHERWDGKGYPLGLSETDIPLAARIVTLADAYDAITSRRPYKEPFSHEEAVRRIVVDREKHFDPVLVDVFVDYCQGHFEVIKDLEVEPPSPDEAAEAMSSSSARP